LIHEQQAILAKNGENARKRQNIKQIEQELTNVGSRIEHLKEQLAEATERYNQLQNDLGFAHKDAETLLDESTDEIEQSIANIEEINRKVRANLDKEKAEEYAAKIEDRLLKAYQRIRSSVMNKLAVVPIQRGASGGSFFTIPPQVQVEIASRKKIITDEHSGRILVDAALAEEEKEKI